MKRLHVRSELPVEPALAWEIFDSAAFSERLERRTGLRSETLSQREDAATVERELRFVSSNELPAVAAKALGSRHLTYDQSSRRDKAASALRWQVKLPVLADRVSVSGTTTIRPLPGGRSERVVDGTIEVRLAIVGGQVEKIVVAEFEKSMARAVDIALELIQERAR